jgi:hypothetical protein
MSEQVDAKDNDGWPVPSRDVLRELDPPRVDWSVPEPALSWPLSPPATG